MTVETTLCTSYILTGRRWLQVPGTILWRVLLKSQGSSNEILDSTVFLSVKSTFTLVLTGPYICVWTSQFDYNSVVYSNQRLLVSTRGDTKPLTHRYEFYVRERGFMELCRSVRLHTGLCEVCGKFSMTSLWWYLFASGVCKPPWTGPVKSHLLLKSCTR